MTDMMAHILEGADAAQLSRAEVVGVTESGSAIVGLSGDVAEQLSCDLLVTSGAPLVLVPGDQVLVWTSPRGGRAVVLGRIGPARQLSPDRVHVPDTVTIEAKQSLTLHVGDGAITIRDDGKILIKGTDVVSHAQRTNRIRGGAVAIN